MSDQPGWTIKYLVVGETITLPEPPGRVTIPISGLWGVRGDALVLIDQDAPAPSEEVDT